MTVLVRADARRLPFADGVAHNDIDFAPALCLYAGVSQSRDSRGRIKPGVRFSPATEFQPGQHWRKPQAFRDAEWLRREYVDKQRSTGEIAAEFGVTEQAIIHWLRRHKIKRRTMSECRAVKRWGVFGENNPMFGKRGPEAPGYVHGLTPERQAFYSSQEWRRVVPLVWIRDEYECRRCGKHDAEHAGYHIHHIIPFGTREHRAALWNLVLLCNVCHRWVHSPANTERRFLRTAEEMAA